MTNRLSLLLRWVGLAIAAYSLSAIPVRAQDAPIHVPTVRATTLAGTEVALPNMLKGKVGILVIGFNRASQEQVSNWGRLITASYEPSPGVAYFEISMLAGTPKMLRGMMVKSLDKSVPTAEKPHYLALPDDDKPWRTAANYGNPDDAYVLVVDGDGVVLWQTQGEVTDDAWASFKPRLEGLLATNRKR